MLTRIVLTVATVLAVALSAAGAETELDARRYMPLSEVRPGMKAVGRTTLKGTAVSEFQVEVLAILERYGPKRALIIGRCSGAGLEESGVISGMSGSPVAVDGRIVGAVAYAFSWCKAPICGIQPIEQMLGLKERFDRRPEGAAPKPAASQQALRGGSPYPPRWERALAGGAAGAETRRAQESGAASVAVPASALASADLPAALADRDVYRMQPIRAPVMVSGMPERAIDALADDLAPYGLVPMAGGGAEHDLPEVTRMEPGAPLAVPLLRGDIQMTVMGTITDVVDDRIYAFGHALFGLGEANYPMMTGVAHVVIPTLRTSFRMGAPVKEIGRLVWDEETGILGHVGDEERAPMVPVTVKVTGPGKGLERSYASEMVRSRDLSGMLAGSAVGTGIIARSDLPIDHTVRYRVRVKPVGREALVRENLAVSPNADSYVVAVVRHLVTNAMENPFENLDLESVEAEVHVETGRRMAEIEKSRALRNRVRPGGTVPVEVRLRPWRQAPRWMTVDVPIPEDYPDGTYTVVVCGGDEALRQERQEVPARFDPDDLQAMLDLITRDVPRDRLYVRLERPGRGIAIGQEELPNLPASMRSVLTTSARRQVTPVRPTRVTTVPMDWVVTGGRKLTVTVDREAPK
ncbi:MAG: SpoIVB peptidase S55 domain-containing protein [Phycisphaerae bacterium]